jgi:replicative DNA helicase
MATNPRLNKLSDESEYSPINPEALLISAYIELGFFTPTASQIEPSDIISWGKLWHMLDTYSIASGGTTPSLDYVKKAYPEFNYTAGVNPDYAANLVRQASALRSLRLQIMSSLDALKLEDLEAAYGHLDKLHRPVTKSLQPVDVFDQNTIQDSFPTSKLNVPFNTLQYATGGIGPGEFWVQAARLGQGKTWLMLLYAAMIARDGYNVAFHALEMPAGQVARRTHQLLTHDKDILKLLKSENVHDRKKAIDHIRENTPGSISILDPSHGRINTTAAILESCSSGKYDIVMVDHAGLLMTADGHRAIEDWRYMAQISNICREITLNTSTPIFASAQINRAGDTNGGKAPSVSNLSQSDALGQDADVVVTMSRSSAMVMRHSAQKVRNGPNLDWYSRFDPAANRFEEISKEAASELNLMSKDISNR